MSNFSAQNYDHQTPLTFKKVLAHGHLSGTEEQINQLFGTKGKQT